ncbi:MAG: hypothetical protein MJ085_03770, partial [Clostridia bacterium]|nr:hypothetical protein [Clostridia bacterium]
FYNTCAFLMQHKDGARFICLWNYHGNVAPYPKREGGIFVNNERYLQEELNPVLEGTVKQYRALYSQTVHNPLSNLLQTSF